MKGNLMKVLLVILAAWMWWLLLWWAYPPSSPIFAFGCGIEPIKPVVPIGCRDLRAQCVCDEKGKNCRWRWVCLK